MLEPILVKSYGCSNRATPTPARLQSHNADAWLHQVDTMKAEGQALEEETDSAERNGVIYHLIIN